MSRAQLFHKPAPSGPRETTGPVELLAHSTTTSTSASWHPQAALVLQHPALQHQRVAAAQQLRPWAPATQCRSARGFAKEHVVRCRAASIDALLFSLLPIPVAGTCRPLVGRLVRTIRRSSGCAGPKSQCDMFLSIPRCRFGHHLHFLREASTSGRNAAGASGRTVAPASSVSAPIFLLLCTAPRNTEVDDEGETQWFTYTWGTRRAAAVRDGGAEPALLHDQPCFSSRACSASL